MTRLRTLAAVVLVTWLVLPLVPLVVWSFARGWRFPAVIPNDWSLTAWRFVLSPGSDVVQALSTSLVIALATTTLAVVIGIPAGRALGLYRFRGKAAVEILMLAPIIVPGIAVALGLHGVFIRLGLTNTFAGVVLVHLVPVLPYMVLVMAGIFQGYDTQHEAQARTLGASPWQVFRFVTWPAILPGVVVGALFAFLVSWSQYVLTLTIGGGRVVTLPLLLFNYVAAGRNDLAGAIAVVYVLPGALVIALTARHLTGRNAALLGRA